MGHSTSTFSLTDFSSSSTSTTTLARFFTGPGPDEDSELLLAATELEEEDMASFGVRDAWRVIYAHSLFPSVREDSG